MNVEEILEKLILYDSNNIGYYNTYYLPLKKYLLYKLLNNCSIIEYNNIV